MAEAERFVGVGVGAPSAPRVPLVATTPRWVVSSAALTAGLAAAAVAFVLFTHSPRPLSSLISPIAISAGIGALLLFVLLREEESRLARELRTARVGTSVLRGLVAGRRQQLPFFARICSTKLGMAAVLVADGDRNGALDALATASRLMRWGRLEKLRAILDADLERSTGTPAGLERCVQALRGMAPIGHREADLYRIHVLVKAVLAQGDGDVGLELASELGALETRAPDDEARVYATWLRVWFDLDVEVEEAEEPFAPLSGGDLRMAILIARAHGAEALLSKLAERLSAIAEPEVRG
jgi:hypothetical protein